MGDDDLAARISKLTDEDAVGALAYVLDLQDATAEDLAQLSAIQGRLPEALVETPGISDLAGPPEPGATPGDLARTALLYLAEQDAAQVADTLGRPRPIGKRDPVILAVGGLIVLALKSEVELKRNTSGKWSFTYRLKPANDSAIAPLLQKLMGYFTTQR